MDKITDLTKAVMAYNAEVDITKKNEIFEKEIKSHFNSLGDKVATKYWSPKFFKDSSIHENSKAAMILHAKDKLSRFRLNLPVKGTEKYTKADSYFEALMKNYALFTKIKLEKNIRPKTFFEIFYDGEIQ